MSNLTSFSTPHAITHIPYRNETAQALLASILISSLQFYLGTTFNLRKYTTLNFSLIFSPLLHLFPKFLNSYIPSLLHSFMISSDDIDIVHGFLLLKTNTPHFFNTMYRRESWLEIHLYCKCWDYPWITIGSHFVCSFEYKPNING